MGFDFLKTLGAIAPAIGTAIGGPFGALAGKAVQVALGLADGATQDDMAKALENATPEQLLAIKQADNQFKLDMEKLGVDLAKIDAEDRDSARQREIAVKDKIPGLLAAFLTIGFFGLLALMCFHDIPKENAAVLNIMLGALGAGFSTMLAYYFGSSAGAARKDAMLLQATPQGGK